MNNLRLPDVRTHRSLGPPHLLARHGTDFTPAATPFCANLRLLLPPSPLPATTPPVAPVDGS